MALRQTTRPAYDPVSFAEAAEHSIVQHPEDNQLIARLVSAATELVEAHTGRQLVTAGWTLTLDQFPRATCPIELRVCPVQAVTAINYIDADGASQELDDEAYLLDSINEPGRLVPAYGLTWPTARRQVNAVSIEFTAGYGTALDVPESAKQAIKLLVGHWYENRESVVVGTISGPIALAFSSLVWSLKWTL